MGLEMRGSGKNRQLALSEFLGKREKEDIDAEHIFRIFDDLLQCKIQL